MALSISSSGSNLLQTEDPVSLNGYLIIGDAIQAASAGDTFTNQQLRWM
jgi:hypothetical protein